MASKRCAHCARITESRPLCAQLVMKPDIVGIAKSNLVERASARLVLRVAATPRVVCGSMVTKGNALANRSTEPSVDPSPTPRIANYCASVHCLERGVWLEQGRSWQSACVSPGAQDRVLRWRPDSVAAQPEGCDVLQGHLKQNLKRRARQSDH